MTTKVTFIYDNPTDPMAFEAGYPRLLVLAKAMPGLQHLETSRVWPKEDRSPTPAYRLMDLYFGGYHTASMATSSEEAGDLFPAVLALATGGVRIVFADIEEGDR